jgi:hypothetical protein
VWCKITVAVFLTLRCYLSDINFLVALPNFIDSNSSRDEIEKVTEQYTKRGHSRSTHLEMEDDEWRWLWAERDWL